MKKVFGFFGLVLLAAVIYYAFETYPKLDLISGFSSKSVASGYFLDHRPLDVIEKGDNDIKLIDLADNKIHEKEKFAEASVYGLKTRKAIFREGLGAVLVNDGYDATQPYLVPKRAKPDTGSPFPYGNAEPKDTLFGNVNYNKLNTVVASAFDKNNEKKRRSRAVIVIYKDKIISEKYAAGFTKNSRILGWSMTKSITATYFGILQQQGKFDINKPAPIPEWQNDGRKNITTSDLLHMNSGLEWNEDYSTISDVTKMLFLDEDMTRSQLVKPAIAKPDTHWNYSSGTTNLLSGILRSQFKTHQEYLDFWYSSLIDKIGMNSMLIEADMKGNYVGSSYAWATPRDWAKFGLLYLHKGNWNGRQILDESWIKYASTPTNTSNGRYGAQFWLNSGGHFPDVPKDMIYCNGYQGQMVAIFPSKDLVIVRMGLTEDPEFNFNGFLRDILNCVK